MGAWGAGSSGVRQRDVGRRSLHGADAARYAAAAAAMLATEGHGPRLVRASYAHLSTHTHRHRHARTHTHTHAGQRPGSTMTTTNKHHTISQHSFGSIHGPRSRDRGGSGVGSSSSRSRQVRLSLFSFSPSLFIPSFFFKTITSSHLHPRPRCLCRCRRLESRNSTRPASFSHWHTSRPERLSTLSNKALHHTASP